MGIRQSETLVRSEFKTNAEGWPTGGTTHMELGQVDGPANPVLFIEYQDGIVGDDGQTGVFVEDVMEAARQRLRFFQSNPNTRCRENAIALTHIETSLAWLDFRTRSRTVQGVENSYVEHSDS